MNNKILEVTYEDVVSFYRNKGVENREFKITSAFFKKYKPEVSGAFDSDNIETAVKNVTKLIDEGVKKQMLCNAIREVLPWENVKQKIRQFDEKKI